MSTDMEIEIKKLLLSDAKNVASAQEIRRALQSLEISCNQKMDELFNKMSLWLNDPILKI